MGRSKETSKSIDALLYGIAIGSVTGTMLVAPNAIIMLEKPLGKIFDHLDERQKNRELSRLRSYMKTQELVRGDYDHGIELTKKGLKRINDYEYDTLEITAPTEWNNRWSLVLFDIPEEKRDRRVAFTRKLEELGYQILQQSVWIHPFSSKEQIYVASKFLNVDKQVTYVEVAHIDNSLQLEKRFEKILNQCR